MVMVSPAFRKAELPQPAGEGLEAEVGRLEDGGVGLGR